MLQCLLAKVLLLALPSISLDLGNAFPRLVVEGVVFGKSKKVVIPPAAAALLPVTIDSL